MIKTALIIERTDVSLGGAERSVFELAGQLQILGIDVTTLAAKGKSTMKNVRVLCDDRDGKRTSLAEFEQALKHHLADNHYDIIHSVLPFDFADIYQPRGGSYAEAVIQNAASYGNKIMSSCKRLTGFANTHRSALHAAEKRLCQNHETSIIAALSEYVKKQFKQHYRLSDNRIRVIPNGVKVDRAVKAGHADKLRTQVLAKFEITEAATPLTFLFAANNFRLKGLTALIKAMEHLINIKTNRPPYLLIVGNGKPKKYRQLANRLGVHGRILFLHQLRNIYNVLAISDVAVLPTWYDPSSRFILEALAGDKPVITTKFNGAAEMFVNNRHGITIDTPADTGALAEAMAYYTNEQNLRQASKAIKKDNIKEKVSIARHAKQLLELYRSILSNRGV